MEFADLEATISLDPSYGDLPVGARIYYTTNGTDPGDVGGEPVTGTLYTGPFAVDLTGSVELGSCTNAVTVVARVYGPSNTDKCLGWDRTEPLLRDLADAVRKRRS